MKLQGLAISPIVAQLCAPVWCVNVEGVAIRDTLREVAVDEDVLLVFWPPTRRATLCVAEELLMAFRIFMKKEAGSSSWPDLQPELLGLVLRRLPSLVDRVRLRAVCRPWRSNARLEPLPPPLPWLTLPDRTFLSIPDGKIIRMPTPDDAFCSGSIDNWMFFVHSEGGCSLMNPFSKATLNISKLVTEWFNANSRYNSRFYKLVAPSSLESSPGSLVALISENGGRLRICQPPIAADLLLHPNFTSHEPQLFPILDIAFFNGKLYGLSCEMLSIFEINYGLNSKPKIASVQCITGAPTVTLAPPQPLPAGSCLVLSYLVECCGRLLMVERKIARDRGSFEPGRTAGFEVFEADLSTKPGQWRCVSKLGDQALFVGKHCSKSFPAGECPGIQEDCIYFICDYCSARAIDPLRDSGAYNMRNGIITPLLSENAPVPQRRSGQWRPTWIFPADAM